LLAGQQARVTANAESNMATNAAASVVRFSGYLVKAY